MKSRRCRGWSYPGRDWRDTILHTVPSTIYLGFPSHFLSGFLHRTSERWGKVGSIQISEQILERNVHLGEKPFPELCQHRLGAAECESQAEATFCQSTPIHHKHCRERTNDTSKLYHGPSSHPLLAGHRERNMARTASTCHIHLPTVTGWAMSHVCQVLLRDRT